VKVTKRQLKNIIKEEIEAVLDEQQEVPGWVDRGNLQMAEDALVKLMRGQDYDRAREHLEAALIQVPKYYKEHSYLHPITNQAGTKESEQAWSQIERQQEPRRSIFHGVNNALAYGGYRAQRDQQQADALERTILSRVGKGEETVGDL